MKLRDAGDLREAGGIATKREDRQLSSGSVLVLRNYIEIN